MEKEFLNCKEKKYLNCKVRCIHGIIYFTTDKIYNINNGILVDDEGSDYPVNGKGFKSINQINEFCRSQFKLVELDREEYLKDDTLNLNKKQTLLFVLNNNKKVILLGKYFTNKSSYDVSYIDNYNNNLTHSIYKHHDIKEIYKTSNNIFEVKEENLIWKRKEIPKLTHNQIEELINEKFELKTPKKENLKEKYFKLAKEKILLFELRNEGNCILVGDCLYNHNESIIEISDYTDSLLSYYKLKSYDVMKIYQLYKYPSLQKILTKNCEYNLIWERLPEYTIEDLVEKIGYEFKYVKE